MIIKLCPQRRDDTLAVTRAGETLVLNGESFDLSAIGEGDTLPRSALLSEWFVGDVERVDGELVVTLLLPNPWNYSQEQAFPADLIAVPDGEVLLPKPLADPDGAPSESAPLIFPDRIGFVDWAQLVTKAIKDAAALAAHLALMKGTLAARNTLAAAQILRIQDRIDTLGYGIEAGEASEADEAEQAALVVTLKAWKTYKFALGKVTSQPAWPASPAWPTEPPIPEIEASPMAKPTVDI